MKLGARLGDADCVCVDVMFQFKLATSDEAGS